LPICPTNDQLQGLCDQVFIEDGVSVLNAAARFMRRVMGLLERGDVFVVAALDRAFRSSLDALTELERLHQRGVQFLSLSQNFDTTTPDGKFLYTLAAALATWEREILSKRTKEGLEAANRRGKRLSCSPKLNEAQVALARSTLETEFIPPSPRAAQVFRVCERTLARALEE